MHDDWRLQTSSGSISWAFPVGKVESYQESTHSAQNPKSSLSNPDSNLTPPANSPNLRHRENTYSSMFPSADAPPSRASLIDRAPLLATRGCRRRGTPCCAWLRRGFSWFRWQCARALTPSRLRLQPRTVHLNGITQPCWFPKNRLRTQKYNLLTFVPRVIFLQFHNFFTAFYLLVTATQLVPQLRVGPLFTYLGPVAFVLLVSLGKEGVEDFQRILRDRELNGSSVQILDREKGTFIKRPAHSLHVGDIIQLETNERVPCDAVLLRTNNPAGLTFIRTEQLDGETDWKLRRPLPATQNATSPEALGAIPAWIEAEPPHRDIRQFTGTFHRSTAESDDDLLLQRRETIAAGTPRSSRDVLPLDVECGHGGPHGEGVNLENSLWLSTIVTEGPVWAIVIYTGRDCRASLNTSAARTKIGLFDEEANRIAVVLLGLLCGASVVLTICRGLGSESPVQFVRFLLLLSTIIPISLRVNLDVAKSFYSWRIERDQNMEGAVVRNWSLAEELGRIDFLFTDKTGTLTMNEMRWRKLHLGRVQFGEEALNDIRKHLAASFAETSSVAVVPAAGTNRQRIEVWNSLRRAILALATCHNVSPVTDTKTGKRMLQATSPDEIALVEFASSVGVELFARDETRIVLKVPGQELHYETLYCFPFNSETKRMGIIVRLMPTWTDDKTNAVQSPMSAEVGKVFLYMKGAETVMLDRVEKRTSHWLVEECDNFARVGLRTLVVAYKEMSPQELNAFAKRYEAAQATLHRRAQQMRLALDTIETNLTVLGLTGVEDRLQENVPIALEAFRHAGIRVWMLTGDKLETATCVAIAAGLKGRQHGTVQMSSREFRTPETLRDGLEGFALGPGDSILVLDGPLVERALTECPDVLARAACLAPAVLCCRCSPTCKASVVNLIRQTTGRRCAAIGDGANDISMIQAADVGIGLVGKEGQHASLTADFSLQKFYHLQRLLFWHGKNSYQSSARLTHFVTHRGLVIAVIQGLFSAVFFFVSLAIFQGWLAVGFSTYYTTLPVLSTIMDVELPESVVMMFPEVYETSRRGKGMSTKTFFAWLWTAVYQGSVIVLGAIVLFESEFGSIVSIAFTSLVLSELLTIATEARRWHWVIGASQALSIVIYALSVLLLPEHFDLDFVLSTSFALKVILIIGVSWVPLFFKQVMKKLLPSRDSKLTS